MKTFFYITNIPTPYRNYRFNLLSKLLRMKGINLKVLFMNESEPDRNWPIEKSNMDYDFEIFSKRQVGKRFGMWFHFPIKMFWFLFKNRCDYMILGGLASPAHFLVAQGFKGNEKTILSVESNINSIQSQSDFAKKIKSYLINKFDFFQVTGFRAKEYIEYYLNGKMVKFINLPNIIDEDKFLNSAEEVFPFQEQFDQEKENGNWIFLLPARLIDKKGILPFLNSMSSNVKVSIFIAGDGPLRNNIEELILTKKINVHLLGNVPSSLMPVLMINADFLLLPSKADPYPLSVIEACSVGLPLIVSKNIGNLEEVLEENRNGYSFSFGSLKDMEKIFDKVNSLSLQEYAQMKVIAKRIYTDQFDSEKVLINYVEQIIEK